MILVTGATGNVGRAVVRRLDDLGIEVRALTRNPDKAELPAGATAVTGSVSDAVSLDTALKGTDKVFLVLSGDIREQARNFAAAVDASDGGLRHVVMLSSLSIVHPMMHTIGDDHRFAEESVRGAGAKWTFLRPGPFHSNALWWAASIRENRTVRCHFGNQPSAPIDPSDVASVAVAALLEDRHIGKTYKLTGAERITSADQVRILGEILGTQITFEETPEEAAIAVFGAMSGDTERATANVRALRSTDVPWASPTSTVLEITGRTPISFREWAESHASLFR